MDSSHNLSLVPLEKEKDLHTKPISGPNADVLKLLQELSARVDMLEEAVGALYAEDMSASSLSDDDISQ